MYPLLADPEHVEYQSNGMNHMEGGWPKDIDPTEKDQTARYRKKVLPLTSPSSHAVLCRHPILLPSCHLPARPVRPAIAGVYK